MTLRYLTYTIFTILLFSGCKDSATDTAIAEGDELTGMAVRVVNTGSGDLEIETDGDANIDFCYEGEGCADVSGQSFHIIYEGSSSNIDYSLPDKSSVGVKVSFRVTKGSGKAEIISGRAYRDDAGFLEFEDGDLLHTSDSFEEGDVVTFTYGETVN